MSPMNCPHCHKELVPQQLGSTVYWGCESCHVLWFDNKESDFLTIDEAQMLHDTYPEKLVLGKSYQCPRCNEALYKDAYYLRCATCGGVLTDGASLVKETQQKAKKFIASGRLTLAQVRSIVVLGAIFIFFGINYVILSTLQHKSTLQTQAAELKTNVHVRNVNNSQMALFFTTDRPYISVAHFYTRSTQWDMVINKEPRIDHFVIFDKPTEQTSVTIILSDVTGKTVSSKEISIDSLR